MRQPPVVGVLRHQQFRPTEGFIAGQAMAMRQFRPLFVARDAVAAAPGTDCVCIAQFGRRAVAAYTLTRRSPALRRLLAQRRPSLLHAHFGVEGVYAVPLARSLRVPLVTTLHGFDVTIDRRHLVAARKASWLNYVAWRRDLFRHGSMFVCVSEYVRRRAVEWGYPEERIRVLPIGVDVELIQPAPPVAAPRVLHVARLVEVKGTSVLLRAFAGVRARLPEAELMIIGEGPLRARLTRLASELGIADAVQFIGARSHHETLEQMRHARVVCLPSVTAASGAQEGLGLALVEAAATGRPVVATTHGGIPEAVTDESTGYLVPEGDAGALADRLLSLLSDPQLCERYGKAGREMAVARFNLSRQTEKLESLYRTLM